EGQATHGRHAAPAGPSDGGTSSAGNHLAGSSRTGRRSVGGGRPLPSHVAGGRETAGRRGHGNPGRSRSVGDHLLDPQRIPPHGDEPSMTAAAPAAPAAPPDGRARRAWVQRRTLRALVVAQVFAGAGLAAGISVGALLAQDLLGSTSGAGLPAALFTAGAAGAAAGVGRLSQRHGRRRGLTVGYLVGAVGGAGVVLAAVAANVPLLLGSLLLYGAGSATNLQCRYAAADLAEESRRGRAVSTVLV